MESILKGITQHAVQKISYILPKTPRQVGKKEKSKVTTEPHNYRGRTLFFYPAKKRTAPRGKLIQFDLILNFPRLEVRVNLQLYRKGLG